MYQLLLFYQGTDRIRTRRGGRRTKKGHSRGCNHQTPEPPETLDENLVHNISSIVLSKAELSVLNKGLGFCPKEKINDFVLKQNLRFKAHFSGVSTATTKELSILLIKNMGLKPKSTKVPPSSCAAVEVYIEKVENDIKKFLCDRKKRDHIPHNFFFFFTKVNFIAIKTNTSVYNVSYM